MKLTPTIHKAINVAARQHFGQNRKVINVPYIIHPFSVALLLSEYTTDEEVIAAGLLHDVLEDCDDYSRELMVVEFGERVASLVYGVSDKIAGEEKKTWRSRKELYLNKLRTNPEGALLITAADKLHNLKSMLDEYQPYAGNYQQSFNSSTDERMWYYGEVVSILKERLKNPIVDELEAVYLQIKATVA